MPVVTLVIVGAGSVGREALDVALAAGVTCRGFADEQRPGEVVRGLPVLAVAELVSPGEYLVAIADPEARRRLAEALDDAGLTALVLVHPRAIIGPETTVAGGCLVMGGAYVSSSVTLGPHAQVHYNATVGHDCRLDACAAVFPGANVAGAVHLAEGATVGSGAVVLQGLSVGAGAIVGAGAVVTRDVAPGAVVVGVPARTLPRP
jgi:sugar O-acyltransferase (sialic acid O-acetyltransferase NeuD family)